MFIRKKISLFIKTPNSMNIMSCKEELFRNIKNIKNVIENSINDFIKSDEKIATYELGSDSNIKIQNSIISDMIKIISMKPEYKNLIIKFQITKNNTINFICQKS